MEMTRNRSIKTANSPLPRCESRFGAKRRRLLHNISALLMSSMWDVWYFMVKIMLHSQNLDSDTDHIFKRCYNTPPDPLLPLICA